MTYEYISFTCRPGPSGEAALHISGLRCRGAQLLRQNRTAWKVCLAVNGQERGVTPFFRMMLPYLAVSPVMTTA